MKMFGRSVCLLFAIIPRVSSHAFGVRQGQRKALVDDSELKHTSEESSADEFVTLKSRVTNDEIVGTKVCSGGRCTRLFALSCKLLL